jgi:hypothetical protein
MLAMDNLTTVLTGNFFSKKRARVFFTKEEKGLNYLPRVFHLFLADA